MDFRPLEWASIGHIVHRRKIKKKGPLKKTDGTGKKYLSAFPVQNGCTFMAAESTENITIMAAPFFG